MFNMLRNQNGMTLVGVIISSVITAIITLQIASLMMHSNKETVKIRQKDELLRIKNELLTVWSDPTNCLESFGGENVSLTGPYAPSLNSENQAININSILGLTPQAYSQPNLLLINSANLQVLSAGGGSPNIRTRIHLIPKEKNGNNIGYIRPATLLMNIQLDAANRINNCSTVNDNNEIQFTPNLVVLVAQDYTGGTYVGPANYGPQFAEDTWRTFNLNNILPENNVTTVLLRIFVSEVAVYARPFGSTKPKNYNSLLTTTRNDGASTGDFWLDISQSPGRLELLYDELDPPTHGFWVAIIGYKK